MYPNTLKSFISRFSYFKQKIDLIQQNFEINILNNEQDKVTGTIIIKNLQQETKQINFSSKISKTNDILIFKTQYEFEGKEYEEIDIFTIINENPKNYATTKTKYLFHIVNNKIIQAYRVGKKYKFENGINESLLKFNMESKEVLELISNLYRANEKKSLK